MPETDINRPRTPPLRQIGTIGTTMRVVVGLVLLADGLFGGHVSAIHGEVRTGFEPLSVAVGVVAFPIVLLAWQWLRTRRDPTHIRATGPVSTAINIVAFLALVLTPWYVRPLAFTSDAALVFYGASMLLAALRGYGGCEVLAVSNWILGRDDQIGCLVLSPVDSAERSLREGQHLG
jgi:hypothetical protein